MMQEREKKMKKPLIVLTGPTAVGKTELSIKLAAQIGGEIISADSMQVYKGMNIGSAKIMPEQQHGIPHYLIDVCEPWEEFHIVKFQEYAKNYIQNIYAHGHIPILTGGTGFYIQAVLYDIDFTGQDKDEGYRKELETLAIERGNECLHQMLCELDPEAAQQIHANNRKRVIRALEFYHTTGKRISEHNEIQQQRTSPYNFLYLVLSDVRTRLYERIDRRVDSMIENGLVQEVQELKALGCSRNMVSMQGLGYKEILDYLDGKYTFDEAVTIIKRDTRHFAKRQITWFKREREVTLVNKPDFDYDEERMLAYIMEELEKRNII